MSRLKVGGVRVAFASLSCLVIFYDTIFSKQIGCRFWDLALREHASTNKVRAAVLFHA